MLHNVETSVRKDLAGNADLLEKNENILLKNGLLWFSVVYGCNITDIYKYRITW